jgi:transcriptional regulator with XRE-family HTH domain
MRFQLCPLQTNLVNQIVPIHVASHRSYVEKLSEVNPHEPANLGLISGHSDVSPWKSAHQAALIGLAHLFPLHSVPAVVVAGDQRHKETNDGDNNVFVSDAVDKKSGASSHKSGVEQSFGAGHSSGLNFWSLEQLSRNALFLTKQSSDNAVTDPHGKHGRPLLDSLVSDADSLSSGSGRTPEKFNGFCFEHSLLNHSSSPNATIVQSDSVSCAFMASPFAQRLADALTTANKTDAQLADHLGLSIQAIRKYSAGTSVALTAANNSRAAKYLSVSTDWLATGEGEMVDDDWWPFTQITLEQMQKWTPQVLDSVQNFALYQVSQSDGLLSNVNQSQTPASTSRMEIVLPLNIPRPGRTPGGTSSRDKKQGKSKRS